MTRYRIAIFASGNGSNAENIVRYLAGDSRIEVGLILSNNPQALVLKRASSLNIPSATFDRKQFYESDDVINLLKKENITHIVLAGFLWLVPASLIDAFPDKIINIHPALLPRYGGKGMYGMKVHQAVKAGGESTSGITVHVVNGRYDEGRIFFQAQCPLMPADTVEDISEKVRALEFKFYPQVIRDWILSNHASTA
jgi:phosphoribosylglycinamide formyltransferase-1